MTTEDAVRPANLLELATVFLRLGLTGFGGPTAHIALMEGELVRRRQWLSHQQFLDLIGAVNLIPGPNSTELAIHVGYRRGGWAGLVVAGTCFILPATLIVTAFAWVYVRFGKLPAASGLLDGTKPVIIAVMVQALLGLTRIVVRKPLLAGVVIGGVFLSLLGVNPMAVLFGAGFVVCAWRGLFRLAGSRKGPGALLLAAAPALAPGTVSFSLGGLFLVFLKVGAVIYGGGYVLLAFLRPDLVEHYHWLTNEQLLDAVTVGQVTPGPLLTTATFIGYVLSDQHGYGGLAGGLIATVGIFLPAFVYVALSGPLLPRLRRSPTAAAFLDGVNAAALALIVVVTWQLGWTALVYEGDLLRTMTAVVLAVGSAVLLLRGAFPRPG